MNALYHCHSAAKSYFFTQKLTAYVCELKFLGDSHRIELFPDAVFKSNRFPTGIAIRAPKPQARLQSLHLRDPGCGFLLFKLEGECLSTQAERELIAGNLTELVSQLDKPSGIAPEMLKSILSQGIQAFDLPVEDQEKHIDECFDVDVAALGLSDEEQDFLSRDFGRITNTLELRRVTGNQFEQDFGLKEGDVLGFIHSGCIKFPSLLVKHFEEKMINQSVIDSGFDLSLIDRGHQGACYDSSLGNDYVNFLHAAMNFAIASRYQAFLAVRDFFHQQASVPITLINDSTHAGIYEIDDEILALRGVQRSAQTAHPFSRLRLIAGESHSVASLVALPSNSQDFLLPHGIGYQTPAESVLSEYFNEAAIQQIQTRAAQTASNVSPEFCPVVNTFNLKYQMDYFIHKFQLEYNGLLEPLVTIQSPALLALV